MPELIKNELFLEDLKLQMYDNGHILGSAALKIDNGEKSILYTGDFTDKNRFFLNGFKPPKADILITEATFGKPEYILPKPAEVIKEAVDWIDTQIKNNKNVILVGYALGKGQILSKIAENFNVNIYADKSIQKSNQIYNLFGIKIKEFNLLEEIPKAPFIALTTPTISSFVNYARRRLNSVSAFFSGWTIDPKFEIDFADQYFPLSDHADFNGLIRTASYVNPSKIYTLYGFSKELAEHMKKEGWDAETLY